jgi:hypothetical protein
MQRLDMKRATVTLRLQYQLPITRPTCFMLSFASNARSISFTIALARPSVLPAIPIAPSSFAIPTLALPRNRGLPTDWELRHAADG